MKFKTALENEEFHWVVFQILSQDNIYSKSKGMEAFWLYWGDGYLHNC